MGRLLLCSLALLHSVLGTLQDQDAVQIEDLDDFAEWSFTRAGLPYTASHEFNLKLGADTDPWLSALRTNRHVTVPDQDDFTSFLEVSPAQNPFNRDTDDLDTDTDDDPRDGHLRFLLVTTFDREAQGSGQVWVVPKHKRSRSFVLLGGLETPTGLCFDKNHDFLYVCDPAQASIFQYSVSVTAQAVVLRSDQVATVYQGLAPTDCAVDSSGALYFSDMANNTISRIDYPNLWAGYVDQQRILYQSQFVAAPMGIDVAERTLYWTNSLDFQDSGVLVSGEVSSRTATVLLRDDIQPLGLTVSRHFVYFISAGQAWAYQLGEDKNLLLKSSRLNDPRGLCFGDGRVYVTDFAQHRIFAFDECWEQEVKLHSVLRIARPYAVACVNL